MATVATSNVKGSFDGETFKIRLEQSFIDSDTPGLVNYTLMVGPGPELTFDIIGSTDISVAIPVPQGVATASATHRIYNVQCVNFE